MQKRKNVYVKGFGEQIPVTLKCSKLKNMNYSSMEAGNLYFKPQSNIYAVLAYFKSTLKKKDMSQSYYVVTENGHVLNASTPLREVYEKHQGKDGILRLEICNYAAF